MHSPRLVSAQVVLTAIAFDCLAAHQVAAQEPDFYLAMQTCKTTVGYLSHSDQDLKVVEGDPARLACKRESSAVTCVISFDGAAEGHKGSLAEYVVMADSPPILMMSDKNGGDFILINTVERAAVVVTRMAGLEYAGSKVCRGLFATAFDLRKRE